MDKINRTSTRWEITAVREYDADGSTVQVTMAHARTGEKFVWTVYVDHESRAFYATLSNRLYFPDAVRHAAEDLGINMTAIRPAV